MPLISIDATIGPVTQQLKFYSLWLQIANKTVHEHEKKINLLDITEEEVKDKEGIASLYDAIVCHDVNQDFSDVYNSTDIKDNSYCDDDGVRESGGRETYVLVTQDLEPWPCKGLTRPHNPIIKPQCKQKKVANLKYYKRRGV